MENQIQLFEHEEFGKIRVIMIDGEPWFVAADACRVLDFKNPSDILKRLDDDEKCKLPESRIVVDPILNIGCEQREVNMVNEPGLYRLIFASRKPEAKKFQRWVYHEVLPSIRKTGSYSLGKKVAVKKPRRRPCPVVAVVYVLLLSNNLVKIGYSANFQRRLHDIRKETGLDIIDYCTSVYMPLNEARLLESALKVKFFDKRTVGEFFCAEFNNVLAALNA